MSWEERNGEQPRGPEHQPGSRVYLYSAVAAVAGGAAGGVLAVWIRSGPGMVDPAELLSIWAGGIVAGSLPGWFCGLVCRLFFEKFSRAADEVKAPVVVAFLVALALSAWGLAGIYSWLAPVFGGF